MVEKHYCFNTELSTSNWGRIHVPLAQKCSMHCIYCNYSFDNNITSNKWRPGTASEIIEGREKICKYLKKKNASYQGVKIIGVSGPGDPLENMDQMRLLVEVLHDYFPDKYLCMCTNGSVYNDDVRWLLEQRILRYITLTINTMQTEKYPLIYRKYRSQFIKRDMLDNQLRIIQTCVDNGIKIKVNTVYQKSITEDEIERMFARLYDEGVSCFNLLPMVNVEDGGLLNLESYEALFNKLIIEGYPILKKCFHCRADSCAHCGKQDSF